MAHRTSAGSNLSNVHHSAFSQMHGQRSDPSTATSESLVRSDVTPLVSSAMGERKVCEISSRAGSATQVTNNQSPGTISHPMTQIQIVGTTGTRSGAPRNANDRLLKAILMETASQLKPHRNEEQIGLPQPSSLPLNIEKVQETAS